MSEGRQKAEAVAMGNKIFAIGGEHFKGNTFLESVECYDILANHWMKISNLPIVKHGFKCAPLRVNTEHLMPIVNKKPCSRLQQKKMQHS